MSRLILAMLLVPTAAFAEDESPPLSIYGFARLDVLADNARMSNINQPLYVSPAAMNEAATGELTMTPRLSQIGLGIEKWDIAHHVTGEGKLEIDFAGGSGTNAIRLRHAYAAVMIDDKVELLAGQTWDLISPLFPSAQNDTQLLDAGNTGDRRPQLRLSIFPIDRVRIAVAAAVNGLIDQQDLDHDGLPDGMESAMPMLQWLLEYRQRVHGDAIARIGIWGHVGRDEIADGTEHRSSSVGGHVFMPLMREVAFLGELYVGINTADIGGGIGQGINPVTGRDIHAVGGWGELALIPTERHMVSLGASVDTANASDLEMGDRERNSTIYGVLRYKPKPSIQFGVEYLYWKTTYKDVGEAKANRFDFHTSFFF
jgi:hypothetical protein